MIFVSSENIVENIIILCTAMKRGLGNSWLRAPYRQWFKLPLFFAVFLTFLCHPAYAEESVENEEKESSGVLQVLLWPFNNIIQPTLNAVVYPFAAPVKYAMNNGLMEKSVDIITFGENKNIMVYPTLNLKPGTETQLGFAYRHRSVFLNRDYLVGQMSYFANGDMYVSARYSKQQLLGLPLFGAVRYKQYWDSDDTFIIPGTKESFVQPDTSIHFEWRLGAPLTESKKLNVEVSTSQKIFNESPPPNKKDSILNDDIFPIADRGLYQNSIQFPFELSIIYDDLDFPYAPSKGSRLILSGEYTHVHGYEGLSYKSIYSDKPGDIEKSDKNHDFISNTIIFQHYFYFGKSKDYILSATEARQSRKFYTDFSLGEALRVWRPENLMETLLERRVLAFQFRMENVWEMEKGGAPYNAFPRMNARYPLRGYDDAWAAYHLMGFSLEYRWPVDRFVDGVIFDEYGLHAEEINKWSLDQYYNSWGFGIRVRMPNLYLFRVQIGFHGLHGVNFITTIVPEFK